MSDIRFNNWKHQSGTGGVSQNSGGNVGIGSTLPSSKLDVGGDGKFTGVVTATSFSGSGANLTGIDASAIKFGGAVKAQANNSGVVITGVATATKFVGDGSGLTGLPSGSDLILEQLALQPQRILVLIQPLLIIMKRLVLLIHFEVYTLVMVHLYSTQD